MQGLVRKQQVAWVAGTKGTEEKVFKPADLQSTSSFSLEKSKWWSGCRGHPDRVMEELSVESTLRVAGCSGSCL